MRRMKPRLQTCALVGHFADPRIAASAAAALSALAQRGVQVLVAAARVRVGR